MTIVSSSMLLSEEPASPYILLLRALLLIPISHYVLGLLFVFIAFLYNFLEIHFLGDLLNGFRGDPVVLTFNPASQVYRDVVSKCALLHGRYLPTPWLCSPNLQTAFLHFFGNPPRVNYKRQIFMTSDGGTLALDWVKGLNYEAKKQPFLLTDADQQDARNPIVIVVPGLTSDSNSSYVKHLVFSMTKRGSDVVVSNHRGLGGVSVTSECTYNAGWTEDVRAVIDHIHGKYPEAPLFVVGTSIGANILVKYLAEDGLNTPVVGAAAICSPWDCLICDRFINRKLLQKLYNVALTVGLRDYAQLHEAVLSRLSNWEGVKKARSVRDFDDSATIILGNYETVDTYYRRCSSSTFIGGVMVPLLCISSLDDPICTSEAIPWDECRLNRNVVLATTKHGGHLPFFEGFAAKSVWWVRAVDEFFCALQTSHLRLRKKQAVAAPVSVLNSSIDHSPYVHVLQDGMVTSLTDQIAETEIVHQDAKHEGESEVTLSSSGDGGTANAGKNPQPTPIQQTTEQQTAPVSKLLNRLSRHHQNSLWLLAYIAVITTWPVLGSTLSVFIRRRFLALFSRPKR